jgi:thioredoxin 1
MSKFVSEITDSNFETEVLQSDKPVLVDFWAVWCGPCKALTPTIEALAEKYNGSVRIVKIDVDENPSVTNRYGIRGMPTLILFKNGREEERVLGAVSRDALSKMIDKHVGTGATA